MWRRGAFANGTAALAAGVALALAAAPAFGQAPAEPATQPAAAYADPTAASDFETRWLETVGAVAPRAKPDVEAPRQRRGSKEQPGITILQLGDSHTAADFFTGELRKRLQAVFGNGGAGYMTAGRPHIGVRSSTFKITVSGGWTYKSLFKTTEPADFWLSGYNAITTERGTDHRARIRHGRAVRLDRDRNRSPAGRRLDRHQARWQGREPLRPEGATPSSRS